VEARLTEALPDVPGWQFEPKWDGFRCLAFCVGKDRLPPLRTWSTTSRPKMMHAAGNVPD
jgi:hypothetical protein